MGLQGDHDCLDHRFSSLVTPEPVSNSGGKFMPESDLREDRFVSFVIEPGMKIGSADSTVGDPEKNFIIFGVKGWADRPGGRPVLHGHIGERLSFEIGVDGCPDFVFLIGAKET